MPPISLAEPSSRYLAFEEREEIATWITGFHHTRRLHSACGFKSPIDYEHDHRAALTEEPAA